jgi:site-specific DNA-methyltransferase (adenine-specific)
MATNCVNDIICCDCVEGMGLLPDECIPMTLTSPPYDRMRDYGGHRWDASTFKAIAGELYRITLQGGVVVWVVADQIVNGGESGTSARQRLYFQRIGFRVHQTIILTRRGTRCPGGAVRYLNPPEYAFVLAKGKPRTINLLRDRPNRHAGRRTSYSVRGPDGRLRLDRRNAIVPAMGVRTSVWEYVANGATAARDDLASRHPAIMPEALAEDMIRSWSRPFDVVFDPMAGAGTTLKMAVLNSRRYLGMEIHEPYCDVARRRVGEARQEHRRRLDEFLARERGQAENML